MVPERTFAAVTRDPTRLLCPFLIFLSILKIMIEIFTIFAALVAVSFLALIAIFTMFMAFCLQEILKELKRSRERAINLLYPEDPEPEGDPWYLRKLN